MILYGRAFRKYGRGKGLDGRREGVGFEDETIVWKSVSRYSRGDYYAARRERGEYIKTRDEVSSYVTIMTGVGREQFHVRS